MLTENKKKFEFSFERQHNVDSSVRLCLDQICSVTAELYDTGFPLIHTHLLHTSVEYVSIFNPKLNLTFLNK